MKRKTRRGRWVPWKRALVWAASQDSVYRCCSQWRKIIRDSENISEVLSRAAVSRYVQEQLLSVLTHLSASGKAPTSAAFALVRLAAFANFTPEQIVERAGSNGWDGRLPK